MMRGYKTATNYQARCRMNVGSYHKEKHALSMFA